MKMTACLAPLLLCICLARVQAEDPTSENLFPLAVGSVWKYRQLEQSISEDKTTEVLVTREVISRAELPEEGGSREEYELRITTTRDGKEEIVTRYAVATEAEVRLYENSQRGGKGTDKPLCRYPRTRAFAEKQAKEEAAGPGLPSKSLVLKEKEVMVPYGKVTGLSLRRDLDRAFGAYEEVVLLAGVGPVLEGSRGSGCLAAIEVGPLELVSFTPGK